MATSGKLAPQRTAELRLPLVTTSKLNLRGSVSSRIDQVYPLTTEVEREVPNQCDSRAACAMSFTTGTEVRDGKLRKAAAD